MSQTRIVVRESALEDVEKLLAVTKLGSPSELFAVMISKYGKHFAATWEMPVMPVEATLNKELSDD